jgi:hypothetical protein
MFFLGDKSEDSEFKSVVLALVKSSLSYMALPLCSVVSFQAL